jgi:hypothetical protein
VSSTTTNWDRSVQYCYVKKDDEYRTATYSGQQDPLHRLPLFERSLLAGDLSFKTIRTCIVEEEAQQMVSLADGQEGYRASSLRDEVGTHLEGKSICHR